MTIRNLKEIMDVELKKRRITQSEAAERVNVSLSTFSRFLSGSRETQPGYAARILREYKPEIEIEFMVDHILKKCSKPYNIKEGLEYLANNRLYSQLREYMDSLTIVGSPDAEEAVKLYRIQLDYHEGKIEPKELYELMMNENIRYDSNKVLARLLTINALERMEQFSYMMTLIADLETTISKLSDEYLRDCYSARLSEVLHVTFLRVLDNPKESRRRCKAVLKSEVGKSFKANAYHTAGSSYIFDSYEKTLKYYTKSKKLYQVTGRKDVAELVEYNIQFAKVLWDKAEEDMFFIDPELKAFYLVKSQKDIEAGLSIINQLDEKEGQTSPVRYYIRGLASGNADHFWISAKLFLQHGQKFLANLPKIELIKLKENPVIIDTVFSLT